MRVMTDTLRREVEREMRKAESVCFNSTTLCVECAVDVAVKLVRRETERCADQMDGVFGPSEEGRRLSDAARAAILRCAPKETEEES